MLNALDKLLDEKFRGHFGPLMPHFTVSTNGDNITIRACHASPGEPSIHLLEELATAAEQENARLGKYTVTVNTRTHAVTFDKHLIEDQTLQQYIYTL